VLSKPGTGPVETPQGYRSPHGRTREVLRIPHGYRTDTARIPHGYPPEVQGSTPRHTPEDCRGGAEGPGDFREAGPASRLPSRPLALELSTTDQRAGAAGETPGLLSWLGRSSPGGCLRDCLKTQAREGERPREPRFPPISEDIWAREDARPPEPVVLRRSPTGGRH
jgi:hypothetical protein